MSYDTDRYLFYTSPSPTLFLTECGIQICHSGHAAPPLKYHDYSIHFILEGKGFYEIGGGRYDLCAGEGFLIKPQDLCTYTADVDAPWKYIYVSFRGTEADRLVQSCGLDKKCVFSFLNDESMQRHLYALHATGKAGKHQGVDALGYFLLAMSRLVSEKGNRSDERVTDLHHLLRAKRYIEDNFSLGIRISDVALHACIERSYLYRIFRKHEKCSPISYLNKIRLEEAKKRLIGEALSISEIAGACGFFDASHFSKAFLAAYGVTPGEYRKSKGAL